MKNERNKETGNVKNSKIVTIYFESINSKGNKTARFLHRSPYPDPRKYKISLSQHDSHCSLKIFALLKQQYVPQARWGTHKFLLKYREKQ